MGLIIEGQNELGKVFLARITLITLFFLDRIYRIYRIFLLFSQFPDGIEKDNPPIGGKGSKA